MGGECTNLSVAQAHTGLLGLANVGQSRVPLTSAGLGPGETGRSRWSHQRNGSKLNVDQVLHWPPQDGRQQGSGLAFSLQLTYRLTVSQVGWVDQGDHKPTLAL